MKRIYMQEYQSELNLNQTIVRMQKDPEGRPFVEVDESLEPFVRGAIDAVGIAAKEVPAADIPDTGIAGPGPTEGVMDIRTHALNSASAKELASSIGDAAEIEALLIGERAHPQFENGRTGVIAALEKRAKELNDNSH